MEGDGFYKTTRQQVDDDRQTMKTVGCGTFLIFLMLAYSSWANPLRVMGPSMDNNGPLPMAMTNYLKTNLMMNDDEELLHIPKLGNLKSFISEVRTKLQNELSALAAMEVLENELKNSPTKESYLKNHHPSLLIHSGRK